MVPANNTVISVWNTQAVVPNISVWPDGCRDLIAIFTPAQPPRIICTGIDSSVRQVSSQIGTRFYGVRFAAGVSLPWDKNSGCKSLDMDISAFDKTLMSEMRRIRREPEKAIELLKEVAQRWVSPAPDWVTEHLNNLWCNERESVTENHLSERSIRRHLARTTGAPPRYWKGLARARHAARALVFSHSQPADIAAHYGFADQAHMSREIRRWFNCTPMMLRRNREHAIARLNAPDAFLRDQSSVKMYCANSEVGSIG
jgi:AraC-like DNA-binding protein